MFHVEDGLFFERLDDGAVRIQKREGPLVGDKVLMDVIVSVDSWCSVVAHMGAKGDVGDRHDAVREMHGAT